MTYKHLSDTYAVTPQISVEDIASLKEAGFGTIICNRPDEEVGPDLQAAAIGDAARAAGLAFYELPVTQQGLTLDIVAEQARIASEATGPVLAYCRSGTRSSIVWALGQAQGGVAVEEIMTTTANAGYAMDGMRPTLESLAGSR